VRHGLRAVKVDFSRLRFLVVDDNNYMRKIIRALLHGFGVRDVFEAEDGASGLESFMANSPDIIITDWEMPILDGLEMLRMVRQPETSGNPFVPVIMISGHAEKRRVMEARDTGVTEFLVKPISTKALYQRIVGVVTQPKPFVRTGSYFGPDRRRMSGPDFDGEDRRKSEGNLIDNRSLQQKAMHS
jgi:CheY-like chemotaxis protein